MLQNSLGYTGKTGKTALLIFLANIWEFASIWPLLKPLLFWRADTKEANNEHEGSDQFQQSIHLVIQVIKVASLVQLVPSDATTTWRQKNGMDQQLDPRKVPTRTIL